MRVLVVLCVVGMAMGRPTRDALCSYGTSNYSLSWTYDELSSDVVFRLTATSPASNFWTGVYFGDDEPFDAIGVFVRNGQIGLVDAHLPPSDDAIVVADESSNVQSLQFDMVEGRLTAEFGRPLSSGDKQDTDLSKCATFFFPEAEEITKTGQITLPTMSMTRRVCDIPRNCPTRRRHAEEQFKREEKEAVAEEETAEVEKEVIKKEAPVVEEEPVAELQDDDKAIEKKDAPAPICSFFNKGSNVSWRLEGNNVIFSVNQANKKGKWYSVFGVGENLQNIRAAVVFTENGKFKKISAIQTLGYDTPKPLDLVPNLLTSANEKGRFLFEFALPKEFFTTEQLTGCITLQFGIYLGSYGTDFKMFKHKQLPNALKICGLDRCSTEKPEENLTSAEGSGIEVEGSGESKILEDAAASSSLPKENEDGLLFNPFKTTETQSKVPEEKPSTEVPRENTGEIKKATSESIEPKKETEAPKKEEVEGSGEASVEIMNATPEPEANKALEAEAATTLAAPVVQGGCSAEHKDLKVCSSYFSDYLSKVEEWARNHEQTIGSQMWKACTLLSEVKHVPTMCCSIYRDTCAEHLKL